MEHTTVKDGKNPRIPSFSTLSIIIHAKLIGEKQKKSPVCLVPEKRSTV